MIQEFLESIHTSRLIDTDMSRTQDGHGELD
jgi:hypothetical protein